jgi:elongation factor Ts
MALEETENDYKKALEWLKKRGLEKAGKKADRETSQGLIDSYIHQGGKIGVLLELRCETDFVAKTDDFKQLSRELGMQISAMNPKDVKELLKQEYIRDPKMTVEDLIKSVIGKLGENITLARFVRYQLGV